jgi:hypothetical protein
LLLFAQAAEFTKAAELAEILQFAAATVPRVNLAELKLRTAFPLPGMALVGMNLKVRVVAAALAWGLESV